MPIYNSTGYNLYTKEAVSAKGCVITDKNNTQYIDFESGVWCTGLGHNNEKVNAALINQLEKISHTGYGYSSPVVSEAAGLVLEIADMPEGNCVFLSSGSEAVEYGIRLASKITEKPMFLCIDGFYLSAYGASYERNPENWISLNLKEYTGNVSEFLEKIPFENIGVFVFEPGNASGTAKLPPFELIKEIEKRIRANKGCIVVDEVTTGIGRTGKWLGHHHYNIEGDIIALGKGIGNGYPVSAVAIRKEWREKAKDTNFKYAQSHQNDPLGASAVKTVILEIKEHNILEKAVITGEFLGEILQKIAGKYKFIKETRGIGLMRVIEFESDFSNKHLLKIHRCLFEKGFITGLNPAANVLRFYPPLIIEKEMLLSLEQALNEIFDTY